MGVTRIQHNLSAMNAMSNYQGNQNTLTGNLEKLSSGYRINSAADDAAGLAISEKMRSQIAGLEKAQDNANDGISLVQTAEGALTEVNSMLTRLKTLATQSANGTYEDGVDRANLQEETNALLEEIDRISQSTNFNGINLLDGSMSNAGIKHTEAGVNINGIGMNAINSQEGKSDVTRMTLEQSNGTGADSEVGKLESGKDYVFKLTYTDSKGETKTGSVLFTAGESKGEDGAVASTKNLAEAINKDSALASKFTASVDDNNKLVLTSKIAAERGTEGDSTTGAAHVTAAEIFSSADGVAMNAPKIDSSEDSYQALSGVTIYDSEGNLLDDEALTNAVKNGEELHTERVKTGADPYVGRTSIYKKADDSKVDFSLTESGKAKFEDGGTIEFATISSVNTTAATSSTLGTVTLTEAGKKLTEDTTFTFESDASISNTGTSAGYTNLSLTAEGKKINATTSLQYSDATVDTTTTATSITGATVANIHLTDKAKKLDEDVKFTFTAASATSNLKGVSTTSAASINENLIGKALTLKEDVTFTLKDTADGLKWTDSDGNAVNIGEYIQTDNITGFDDAKAGSTVKIEAAAWKASGKTINGVVNIGDYISSLGNDAAPADGDFITIKASGWTDTTNNRKIEIEDYISGGISGEVKDGTTIQISSANDYGEGVWTASGGELDGKKFNQDEARQYFSVQNNSALTDGSTVATSAGAGGQEWYINGEKSDATEIAKYLTATNGGSDVAISALTGDDYKAGKINIKIPFAWGENDHIAKEGEDYKLSRGSDEGQTAKKTYDLSSLNDGDRVQINGKNYTFRANEDDVKSATDFHNGAQLASMSDAVSVGDSDDDAKLNKIEVEDQFEEGDSLSLQVGDTNKDYQKVSVDIKDMSTIGLGLSGLDISTQENAAKAIDTIQTAVNAVSTQRGKLGALQNRLDHTLNNLDATTQNITAAESQIRDVDMAKEMTQYSKNNILVQAAQSMLAQANSLPQGVLSLLQ